MLMNDKIMFDRYYSVNLTTDNVKTVYPTKYKVCGAHKLFSIKILGSKCQCGLENEVQVTKI